MCQLRPYKAFQNTRHYSCDMVQKHRNEQDLKTHRGQQSFTCTVTSDCVILHLLLVHNLFASYQSCETTNRSLKGDTSLKQVCKYLPMYRCLHNVNRFSCNVLQYHSNCSPYCSVRNLTCRQRYIIVWYRQRITVAMQHDNGVQNEITSGPNGHTSILITGISDFIHI